MKESLFSEAEATIEAAGGGGACVLGHVLEILEKLQAWSKM